MAKFARVISGEADAAALDQGVANINEMVIPRARELPGFLGGYWLVDRERGKILSVTVFESEEHVRQSDEAAAQIRQDAGGSIGVTFTSVETWEVAAEA